MFSEDQEDMLGNISQYLAIASFAFCLLLVMAVLVVPTLRDGERFQTIATMCFCSALFEATYIFGKNRTNKEDCRILGPLDQAGSVGVVVWNFIMSMELYVLLCSRISRREYFEHDANTGTSRSQNLSRKNQECINVSHDIRR